MRRQEVIVYMDILVISATIKQHLRVLQEVFRLFVGRSDALRVRLVLRVRVCRRPT